jgi:hypothetical protein
MSLPSGSAVLAWCPHRAGSKDCLQVGPGLPRVWPYRLAPDLSGAHKVGEGRPDYQCAFSIAPGALIAGGPDRRRPEPRLLGFLTGGTSPAGAPTSGCRAWKRRGALQISERPDPCRPAADTCRRNSPTELGAGSALNWRPSYPSIRIRTASIILDLVFGRFLESARLPDFPSGTTRTRCRTRRVGRDRPHPFRASGRQRTNPNEEPTVTVPPQAVPPCGTPRRKEVL